MKENQTMCHAKPGLRCINHAAKAYYDIVDKPRTTTQQMEKFEKAQRNYDLVVVKLAGIAKANVEYYDNNPSALANANAKDRANYERDLRVLDRYTEIKGTYTPSELTDLRFEATALSNASSYVRSGRQPDQLNLPTNNYEIVRMFDAVEEVRPLTSEEEKARDEASLLFAEGHENTDHTQRQAIAWKGKPPITTVAPSTAGLQRILSPEVIAEKRALREQSKAQLLQLIQDKKTPVADHEIKAPSFINQDGLKRPTLPAVVPPVPRNK
jgi:hypothetical protein